MVNCLGLCVCPERPGSDIEPARGLDERLVGLEGPRQAVAGPAGEHGREPALAGPRGQVQLGSPGSRAAR